MALHVLVVDDWKDSADSLAMLMELWGHEVRTACSGVESLEITKSFRPDVVLLDIAMPGMDGYEVAQRLRRDFSDNMTIIGLSAFRKAEDRERLQQDGFDNYLVKPADPDELRRLLESCRSRIGSVPTAE
jgi:CheY-like chemotaxis protein